MPPSCCRAWRSARRLDGPEIFLPYLSGERTPHNDPAARGVLFGLNHDSDAAAIGQAVLEGVAFAFADGLDVLIEAGATIDKISVIGGGARSMWWGGVLAAALKRPLDLPRRLRSRARRSAPPGSPG